MSTHLMRSRPQTGRDLAEFWARRIRRLLPASFVVLLFTLVAGRLILPPTRWDDNAIGVIASATFWQNWNLASSSVQYLAADAPPSVTQHYWSLSVEEQFYVIWPLMFLAVIWCAVKLRLPERVLEFFAILGVVLVSLAISISWTATEPGFAYFATPTRVWELALGGLVALLLPMVARWSFAVRRLMMIGGLLAILYAAFAFSETTPFPGTAALVPTLGAAALIAAGASGEFDRSWLVRPRSIQWLGDASYSVYLWHWPLVIMVPFVLADQRWLIAPTVLVLTLVLSAWSLRFVEARFRTGMARYPLGKQYAFTALGLALVLSVAALQLVEVQRDRAAAQSKAVALEASGDRCFGAGSLAYGPSVCPPGDPNVLVPAPDIARTDKSDAYADDCWSNEPFNKRPTCTYGTGPTQVALVGNSHAGHWLPALQRIADDKGWTITTYLVSRCNLTTLRLQFDTPVKADRCLDYADWVLKETSGDAYDLVITSERQSVPLEGATWEETRAQAPAGYTEYLKAWSDSGAKVVVIKDTPDPGRTLDNVPDCLAANPGDLEACSGTPETWAWMDPLGQAAEELGDPSVDVIDMGGYFCTREVCPPVIGSVVAYFDASHISATYGRTLAPYLSKKLDAVA
jgi:peptidoglycan/LPS O-acetylase OafA/YrhL